MKLIFCIVIFNIFGPTHAFWSACPGSNIPTLDSIKSPNCTDRCRAVRGGTFYGALRMTFKKTHKELRSRVTAFIFGIGINIPPDPRYDNQCNLIKFTNGTRAGCPTIPNTQYLLEVETGIPTYYPSFSNTRIQVDYMDGNERVLCYQAVGDLV